MTLAEVRGAIPIANAGKTLVERGVVSYLRLSRGPFGLCDLRPHSSNSVQSRRGYLVRSTDQISCKAESITPTPDRKQFREPIRGMYPPPRPCLMTDMFVTGGYLSRGGDSVGSVGKRCNFSAGRIISNHSTSQKDVGRFRVEAVTGLDGCRHVGREV